MAGVDWNFSGPKSERRKVAPVEILIGALEVIKDGMPIGGCDSCLGDPCGCSGNCHSSRAAQALVEYRDASPD